MPSRWSAWLHNRGQIRVRACCWKLSYSWHNVIVVARAPVATNDCSVSLLSSVLEFPEDLRMLLQVIEVRCNVRDVAGVP